MSVSVGEGVCGFLGFLVLVGSGTAKAALETGNMPCFMFQQIMRGRGRLVKAAKQVALNMTTIRPRCLGSRLRIIAGSNIYVQQRQAIRA